MVKKTLLWILVLVLCVSFASAVKPVTTQINFDTGLKIIYPAFVYIPSGSEFELQFHVHNSTNFLQSNTTCDCNIHIYDNEGVHLVDDNLTYDTASKDFYYNFNTSGKALYRDYLYIVYCNSTEEEAGFVASTFQITERAQEPQDTTLPAVLVFTTLITLFIILGIANTEPMLKWASFILAFFQTFIMLGFIMATATGLYVNWLLTMNFILTGIVGFGLVFFSFVTRSINLMRLDEPEEKSDDRFASDRFNPKRKK